MHSHQTLTKMKSRKDCVSQQGFLCCNSSQSISNERKEEEAEKRRCPREKKELTLLEFMRKEMMGRERAGKDESFNGLQSFFGCVAQSVRTPFSANPNTIIVHLFRIMVQFRHNTTMAFHVLSSVKPHKEVTNRKLKDWKFLISEQEWGHDFILDFFFLNGVFFDCHSGHTLALWSVKANMPDKAAAPPQDQLHPLAVMLRFTTTAISQGPDLCRPHDFVSKLLSPHFKVSGKPRLPATTGERRMLCSHIIRSRMEEQIIGRKTIVDL